MTSTSAKHPLDPEFRWQQAVATNDLVTPERLERYNAEGFFRVEQAFDAAQLASVIAAIDPLEAETEAFLRAQENGTKGIGRAGEISFRPHLVTQSTTLRTFSRHRVFQQLATALLGADARLYWDQSVYKKPGTRVEFPWHQDNGYTFVEPQQYLTCWVALTAASVDNGCPWVVPGAHLDGTLRHELTPLGFQCLQDPPGAVPIELDAGSVAVFSSLTPHRTGPNLTGEVRKSYILQYAPDGALAFPREPGRMTEAAGGGPGIPCNDPQRQYFVVDQARADSSVDDA